MKCRALYYNNSDKDKAYAIIKLQECEIMQELSEKYNRVIVLSKGKIVDFNSGMSCEIEEIKYLEEMENEQKDNHPDIK